MRPRYRPSEATLRDHALDRLVQAAHPAGGQDPAIDPRLGGTVLEWCKAAGIGHQVEPAEVVAKLSRRPLGPLDTRPSSPLAITQAVLRTLHRQGLVDRVGLTDRYRPSKGARLARRARGKR